jgi:hypothetical protein
MTDVDAETPYGSSRGVLLSFGLSLSCDRASSETNRISSRRASSTEDVDALELDQFRIRTLMVSPSRARLQALQG